MFHMATFDLNSQGDRFNHLSSRFSLDLLSKEPAALMGWLVLVRTESRSKLLRSLIRSRFSVRTVLSHVSPQCTWDSWMIYLVETFQAPALFCIELVSFLQYLLTEKERENKRRREQCTLVWFSQITIHKVLALINDSFLESRKFNIPNINLIFWSPNQAFHQISLYLSS